MVSNQLSMQYIFAKKKNRGIYNEKYKIILCFNEKLQIYETMEGKIVIFSAIDRISIVLMSNIYLLLKQV